MEKRTESARNQALAANLKRLRAGRSIGVLRTQMAERGIKIGQGTLQAAINGNVSTSSRLETLEKIADFFETTVDQLLQFEGVDETYWPFSTELQQKVLTLEAADVSRLENVMRAHLGMSSVSPVSVDAEQRTTHSHVLHEPVVDYPVSQQERGVGAKRYPALEEAARYADDGNGSTQHQPASRRKGGGRA